MASNLDKDTVRAANRLEDIIPALTGSPLTRYGTRELVTRCTWHEDQHPSLRVNVEKQVWRCDPCNLGGDVFEFVQRYQHLTFPGALAWLADRAGLSNGNGHRPGATPSRRAVHSPEREHIYRDERGTPVSKVVI